MPLPATGRPGYAGERDIPDFRGSGLAHGQLAAFPCAGEGPRRARVGAKDQQGEPPARKPRRRAVRVLARQDTAIEKSG
jgi:hypothetical protein